ncbi:MAG: hypothetical protein N4Q32_02145, partial [Neisseriaceae bacterium]|nr:hypothetical protein [Neisseriaceae bacterium]
MKFIENQISSAISDIRSRVRGKVSPERAALDTMSKIDTAHNKKIQMPKDMDEEVALVDEVDTSVGSSQTRTTEYDSDPSLSVQYKGARRARSLDISNNDSDSVDSDAVKYQTNVSQGSIKKIIAKSVWGNNFVKAAVPSLLAILPIISGDVTNIDDRDLVSLKLQLTKQIEDFRTVLLSAQYLPEDVDNMGYMLCSFLNEKLAEHGIVFDTDL